MFLALAHAFCNVSVMPLRTEPFHTAEQCNQLLFGEGVEILEVNNRDWAKVSCSWDGYIGWCKLSQLTTVSKKEHSRDIKYIAGSHSNKIVLKESEMWLPLGSDIRPKVEKWLLNGQEGKYKGEKIRRKDAKLTCDTLKTGAFSFLNAPYQWGGRTIAGIDCSGLVQMALKLCNFPIVRDADEQSNVGQLVDFLQYAQCGDLAFFDNKDGKITHVGILLDNQTIIHATDASGKVVVDKIDQGGIISVSLRKRTHNLRLVKRIM